MDLRLRILKRQAEADPSLLPNYVRALERLASGEPVGPIKIWTVIFCHDETSSSDIRVFASPEAAERYMMEQQLHQMRQVHAEGAIPTALLEVAEASFAAGNAHQLASYYESMTELQWFEVDEKDLGP